MVHKTAASFLLCYVDHHDDAYKWAERRRIEAHPKTGAAQIVEVRERVEEIPIFAAQLATTLEAPKKHLVFDRLSGDELLDVGVPEDWVSDILAASVDDFLQLSDHLPDEAAENLLEYAATGRLIRTEFALNTVEPFEHPDALRRFRVIDDADELQQALDYPWDQWAIFLHPSQKDVVERQFDGPARVAGSAGTGKTVVALHRAARIWRTTPSAKILLTTFSAPLSNSLKHKFGIVSSSAGSSASNVTVLPFADIAAQLYTLIHGHEPRIASDDKICDQIQLAMAKLPSAGFSDRFLLSEWRNVIDAWQIENLDQYTTVPRIGRKGRLGAKQRERAWSIFKSIKSALAQLRLETKSSVFKSATDHYTAQNAKPFTHIIVDEAQDLGVPELRMLSAICNKTPDALFFAGDLGQRIFQEPFSWKALGVDIRGRSSTLKVNYRTSHQIRETVDRLLPSVVRDVDGIEEERNGTVSVFKGPKPEICVLADIEGECDHVAAWIANQINEGTEPEDIGIFVRSRSEIARARSIVQSTNNEVLELSERVEVRKGRISIGTMHLAKGLEFKSVAVIACDEDILPKQERLSSVADETELDHVYETERHLFYVACTRARDHLLITGIHPGSEYLDDISAF